MVAELQRKYLQPCIGVNVETFIKACVKCQVNKHSSQPKIGKLRPLSNPRQNLEFISMDFMKGIPKTRGLIS